MLAKEKLYTIEEFHDFVDLPENQHRRLELVHGVIVNMGSSRRINTVIAARIITFFNVFVIPRNLGYVSGPDGGYEVGESNVRRPDVGFITLKRAETLKGVDFDGAPDIAVEVVSKREDVFDKANIYFAAGANRVWLVYPNDRAVYVLRLNEDGGMISHRYGVDDTLDGGDALPGFTLKVSEIFP